MDVRSEGWEFSGERGVSSVVESSLKHEKKRRLN